MPSYDFRCVHMPYCLQQQEDGTYIVLNRDYKPVGFYTQKHVKYEDYPIKVKMRITKATAKNISWKGSDDTKIIHLYDGDSAPTKNAKKMQDYMNRLEALSKLKVS